MDRIAQAVKAQLAHRAAKQALQAVNPTNRREFNKAAGKAERTGKKAYDLAVALTGADAARFRDELAAALAK